MASLALALATLAWLVPGVPAHAQPTPRDVRAAEQTAAQRREAAEEAALRARTLAEQEVALAARRVELAAVAQEAEIEVAAASERLAGAQQASARAAREIAERTAALRPLLPVMLRLSLYPAETVLAIPGPPEDTLRGALVLRGLVRRLEGEATALRQAQTEARQAEWLAARESLALAEAEAAARQAVAGLEAELAVARERRGDADMAEQQAAEQAAIAAARAGDLAAVVARLQREQARREARERANAAARAAEQARQAAEAENERRLAAARERREAQRAERQEAARTPRPDAGASRDARRRQAALPVPAGGRALPVVGRISLSWGQAAPGGPHRGLTYATASGARVVSPCNGRAVYAAPFRTFGLLLIVDCGGGYHFVLAGMNRLDAAAGQRLLAGEPVGILGGSGASGGSLYVELRRNGQPVDPRPWFAARG